MTRLYHLAFLMVFLPSTLFAAQTPSQMIPLDGTDWQIAKDPDNIGQTEGWFNAVPNDVKPIRVPGILEETFCDYDGIVWYYKKFEAPANPHRDAKQDGRSMLRFWAVDFKADVWLNGKHLGTHEGGEAPFTLDATDAVKQGEVNLLVVRVLNPTNGENPPDGIRFAATPHGPKCVPFCPGLLGNCGGIVDSVEFVHVPAARITDVFVKADLKTGELRIETSLLNVEKGPLTGELEISVAPTQDGSTIHATQKSISLTSGENKDVSTLKVENHQLWDLKTPYLYRVTVKLKTKEHSDSFDERSVKTGFRELVFRDGFFRLNGHRVFLKCAHTGNHLPTGARLPYGQDRDFYRLDLINGKMMGFNTVRFIASIPARHQLDLADELGLMVYEECYAAWTTMEDSPRFEEWFDDAIRGMILRDRNHPSVVMWGLLNECASGKVNDHATKSLGLVRELDDTRLVLYHSGRWDLANGRETQNPSPTEGDQGEKPLLKGTLSNPGQNVWEDTLDDHHPYRRVPHTTEEIKFFRTVGEVPYENLVCSSGGGKPYFPSEYGIGSGVNWSRVLRLYHQRGGVKTCESDFYQAQLDRFTSDYHRWKMDEVFCLPETFFKASIAQMADQRALGLNAIRSNPSIVGYSMTALLDQGITGEGLWTTFRELKPGTTDAIFDGFAPLRWCTFVEPLNTYTDNPVTLDVVLANEDVLSPGTYPARAWVFGPNREKVYEKAFTITVPETEGPFVIPAIKEQVQINGPTGKYRLVVAFEKNAAAAGGETTFYRFDRADMPKVTDEVLLWGDDPKVEQWLKDNGIKTVKFDPSVPNTTPQKILALSTPANPDAAFADLAERIKNGSNVVFLSEQIFRKGEDPTGYLPLEQRGSIRQLEEWLYHVDQWAKCHPVFAGMQADGLMDYDYYREIIPTNFFVDTQTPTEAISGANSAARHYEAGLMVATYKLGKGQFLINTLLIRENLGTIPQAERLLRNLLNLSMNPDPK